MTPTTAKQFNQKDADRIAGILSKQGIGRRQDAARAMAAKITDPDKVLRRALAAEESGAGSWLSDIFYKRYRELRGPVKSKAKPKLKTFTVRELRELLEGEDDDKPVVFTSDYGDYHHTKQALPIRGDVEERKIEESAYSHSGFALMDEEDDNGTHAFSPDSNHPDECRICGDGKEDHNPETEDDATYLVIS